MKLNKYIDHTLLKPEADIKSIEKLCKEAVENDFYALCVNPYRIELCNEILKKYESRVKIATVCGFPLGANEIEVKAREMELSFKKGADEVDVVINIGAVKDGDYSYIERELETLKNIANSCGGVMKPIIETPLLNHGEIVRLCEIVLKLDIPWIKTGTGMVGKSVEVEDVILMKKILRNKVFIKASGGIKNKSMAIDLVKAGAMRLGTSKSLEIIGK